MERFYFTFMMSDAQRHNCYHVEEAESYEEAREKMADIFRQRCLATVILLTIRLSSVL